jgi:hypothetical protein
MSEPRIDRHHQHLVDVRHPDAVYRTVQVPLPMDDQGVRPRFREWLQKTIRVRDHQVTFKPEPRDFAQRRDDRRAHRKVGDKAPIHHVDVNAIGPALLRLAHLFAKTREVGGKNRRSDLHPHRLRRHRVLHASALFSR